MTTVPGHNNILPQSKIVQEQHHLSQAAKPSPDQAAAIQQAQQTVKNTSVQGSEESERIKQEKDRLARKENKKKKQREASALDPEATGQLLDTTA